MPSEAISVSNPFPSYPVIRLDDDSVDIQSVTVKTPDILRVTEYIDDYCQQYHPKERRALVVGIKGDYGSGKTHLIKYALSHLRKRLGSAVEVTSIAVPATEEAAFGWYRHAVAPALRDIGIGPLLETLMAEAAARVASRARITKGVIDTLERQPSKIWAVFSDAEVDTTEVMRAYREILKDLCDSARESVRRVLERVPFGETSEIALSWLCAVDLDTDDLTRLGVASKLASLSEATGVLEAIAAILRHVGRQLVFVIDEFEHLARFDKAGQRSNVTWTKRLIEGLAARDAIVFISGHLDAWLQLPDFEDRFSPEKPAITLLNIKSADVLSIVEARMPYDYEFGTEQADTVVALTGGRMREVMSLLSVLFRKSGGMKRLLNPEEIAEIAGELKQRPNLSNVIMAVHGALERLGLAVKRNEQHASGIHLDLGGFSEGRLRVAVEVDHIATERNYIENAHLFREQINKLRESDEDLIGVYLARGNIDDQYLDEQKALRAHRIFFFDLDDRDVFSRLESQLDEVLYGSERRQEPGTWKISRRASEIEAHRIAEAAQTQLRMERLSDEAVDTRRAELIRSQSAPDSRTYGVYRELSKSPSILKRLRYVPLPNVVLIVAALVTGFAGISLPVNVWFAEYPGPVWVLLPYATAAFCFLLAFVLMWRTLVRIDKYFAFAARQMRELYVREVSEAGLVRASNIIEGTIESIPLLHARQEAEFRLGEAFQELRYQTDRNVEAARSF